MREVGLMSVNLEFGEAGGIWCEDKYGREMEACQDLGINDEVLSEENQY